MKKLTKEQRKAIYERVLSKLEETNYSYGLCYELSRDAKILMCETPDCFPEFASFEPEIKPLGGPLWFKSNRERIKCLEKCIEMCQ